MKKKRLLPFLIVALVLLACRMVPARLDPFARLRTTPQSSPSPLAALSPTPKPAAAAAPTSTGALAPAPSLTPLAPVPFHDQVSEQVDKDNPNTIKLRYPAMDVVLQNADGFNAAVQREVDATVAQFKKDVLEASQFPADVPGSFLDLGYQPFYNQDGLVSLQLTVMVYIKGAAHPNSFTIPLNYDLRNGRELALADLFLPDSPYLELLSGLCSADLQKRDLPLFIEGALPKPENYRSWNLTPDGLRITFDPYQVAAYAAGPQVVQLNWAALRTMLAPRLGLPLP